MSNYAICPETAHSMGAAQVQSLNWHPKKILALSRGWGGVVGVGVPAMGRNQNGLHTPHHLRAPKVERNQTLPSWGPQSGRNQNGLCNPCCIGSPEWG